MPLFSSADKTPQRVLDIIKASKTTLKAKLADERLDVLPKALFKSNVAATLKLLDVSTNNLAALPPTVSKLQALTTLDASANALASLPDELGALTALTRLNVASNSIAALPDSVSRLGRLQFLDVSNNALTALPDGIGGLSALKELELTRNAIAALPDSVSRLRALRLLDLGHNELGALPPAVGELRALKDLSLKHNNLAVLPASIGNLTDLRILNVSENALNSLPVELAALRSTLAIVDFQGNPLTDLPPHIRSIPTAGLLHHLEHPDDAPPPPTLLSPANRITALSSPAFASPATPTTLAHSPSLAMTDDPADLSSDSAVSSDDDARALSRPVVTLDTTGAVSDAHSDSGDSSDGSLVLSAASTPPHASDILDTRARIAFGSIDADASPDPVVLRSGSDAGYVVRGDAGGINREATMSRIAAAFESARASPDVALGNERDAAAAPSGPFGPRTRIMRPDRRGRTSASSHPLRTSNSLLSATLASPAGRRATRSAVGNLPREFDFGPSTRPPPRTPSLSSFGATSPFPSRHSSPPPRMPRLNPLPRAAPSPRMPGEGVRLSMALEPSVASYFSSSARVPSANATSRLNFASASSAAAPTATSADTLRATNAFLRSAPSSLRPAAASTATPRRSSAASRPDSYSARYRQLTST